MNPAYPSQPQQASGVQQRSNVSTGAPMLPPRPHAQLHQQQQQAQSAGGFQTQQQQQQPSQTQYSQQSPMRPTQPQQQPSASQNTPSFPTTYSAQPTSQVRQLPQQQSQWQQPQQQQVQSQPQQQQQQNAYSAYSAQSQPTSQSQQRSLPHQQQQQPSQQSPQQSPPQPQHNAYSAFSPSQPSSQFSSPYSSMPNSPTNRGATQLPTQQQQPKLFIPSQPSSGVTSPTMLSPSHRQAAAAAANPYALPQQQQSNSSFVIPPTAAMNPAMPQMPSYTAPGTSAAPYRPSFPTASSSASDSPSTSALRKRVMHSYEDGSTNGAPPQPVSRAPSSGYSSASSYNSSSSYSSSSSSSPLYDSIGSSRSLKNKGIGWKTWCSICTLILVLIGMFLFFYFPMTMTVPYPPRSGSSDRIIDSTEEHIRAYQEAQAHLQRERGDREREERQRQEGHDLIRKQVEQERRNVELHELNMQRIREDPHHSQNHQQQQEHHEQQQQHHEQQQQQRLEQLEQHQEQQQQQGQHKGFEPVPVPVKVEQQYEKQQNTTEEAVVGVEDPPLSTEPMPSSTSTQPEPGAPSSKPSSPLPNPSTHRTHQQRLEEQKQQQRDRRNSLRNKRPGRRSQQEREREQQRGDSTSEQQDQKPELTRGETVNIGETDQQQLHEFESSPHHPDLLEVHPDRVHSKLPEHSTHVGEEGVSEKHGDETHVTPKYADENTEMKHPVHENSDITRQPRDISRSPQPLPTKPAPQSAPIRGAREFNPAKILISRVHDEPVKEEEVERREGERQQQQSNNSNDSAVGSSPSYSIDNHPPSPSSTNRPFSTHHPLIRKRILGSYIDNAIDDAAEHEEGEHPVHLEKKEGDQHDLHSDLHPHSPHDELDHSETNWSGYPLGPQYFKFSVLPPHVVTRCLGSGSPTPRRIMIVGNSLARAYYFQLLNTLLQARHLLLAPSTRQQQRDSCSLQMHMNHDFLTHGELNSDTLTPSCPIVLPEISYYFVQEFYDPVLPIIMSSAVEKSDMMMMIGIGLLDVLDSSHTITHDHTASQTHLQQHESEWMTIWKKRRDQLGELIRRYTNGGVRDFTAFGLPPICMKKYLLSHPIKSETQEHAFTSRVGEEIHEWNTELSALVMQNGGNYFATETYVPTSKEQFDEEEESDEQQPGGDSTGRKKKTKQSSSTPISTVEPSPDTLPILQTLPSHSSVCSLYEDGLHAGLILRKLILNNFMNLQCKKMKTVWKAKEEVKDWKRAIATGQIDPSSSSFTQRAPVFYGWSHRRGDVFSQGKVELLDANLIDYAKMIAARPAPIVQEIAQAKKIDVAAPVPSSPKVRIIEMTPTLIQQCLEKHYAPRTLPITFLGDEHMRAFYFTFLNQVVEEGKREKNNEDLLVQDKICFAKAGAHTPSLTEPSCPPHKEAPYYGLIQFIQTDADVWNEVIHHTLLSIPPVVIQMSGYSSMKLQTKGRMERAAYAAQKDPNVIGNSMMRHMRENRNSDETEDDDDSDESDDPAEDAADSHHAALLREEGHHLSRAIRAHILQGRLYIELTLPPMCESLTTKKSSTSAAFTNSQIRDHNTFSSRLITEAGGSLIDTSSYIPGLTTHSTEEEWQTTMSQGGKGCMNYEDATHLNLALRKEITNTLWNLVCQPKKKTPFYWKKGNQIELETE